MKLVRDYYDGTEYSVEARGDCPICPPGTDNYTLLAFGDIERSPDDDAWDWTRKLDQLDLKVYGEAEEFISRHESR